LRFFGHDKLRQKNFLGAFPALFSKRRKPGFPLQSFCPPKADKKYFRFNPLRVPYNSLFPQ
jgi:hypothetical protein